MVLELQLLSAQVELAESIAVEETVQLSSLVQELHAEKADMTVSLQKMEREKRYLSEENALLRSQLPSSATPEPGLGGDADISPNGVLRQGEETAEDQVRLLQMEHENILLRARIAALEKASRVRLGVCEFGWQGSFLFTLPNEM